MHFLHPQLCWHHTGGALGDALHAGDAVAAFLTVRGKKS